MSGFTEGARTWQPREMAMVTEYLRERGLLAGSRSRVRLGMPAPVSDLQGVSRADLELLRVWARWADAVVIQPDRVVLLEAKIRPRLGPLEALLLYKRLFLNDPEYQPHWHKPIELRWIYAIEDPLMVGLAQELGIVPELFRPHWLPNYLKLLSARERGAPRSEFLTSRVGE